MVVVADFVLEITKAYIKAVQKSLIVNILAADPTNQFRRHQASNRAC
jgi:hypothetical protein